MDFIYEIIFETDGRQIRRVSTGQFYPHDGGFNLEHMLWLMTEEHGRPESITVHMEFISVDDLVSRKLQRLAPPVSKE